MKKKRKKYIKIAVGVVVFILFIAVLGYGLQYVDNKTEKANVSDESSINECENLFQESSRRVIKQGR